MRIDPKQKLKNNIFYNNLLLIMCIFSIIGFITSFVLNHSVNYIDNDSYIGRAEGTMFGPIVVQNKPEIYEIKAKYYSDNSSVYVSGEVLDEDKDTLYEFGKDLWHESGYDDEGHWSECDRNMTAMVSFTEPGTYYINLKTEGNDLAEPSFIVSKAKASGIPHFIFAVYLLLFAAVGFVCLNFSWVKEKLSDLNDILEEASEEDD